MKLTKDQVKHVAKLANLPLTEAQEEEYSEQLSQILDYVEQLNILDTKNVEPTFNVSKHINAWREDEIKEGLSQEAALMNASDKENGLFITKGIFEEK